MIIFKRLLATLIDLLFLAIAWYAVLYILGYRDLETVLAPAWRTNAVMFGSLSLLSAVSIGLCGRTLGQALAGLRVIKLNGSTVPFSSALFRGLLMFSVGSLFGIPYYGLIYLAWGSSLCKLLLTGAVFWDDWTGTTVVHN